MSRRLVKCLPVLGLALAACVQPEPGDGPDEYVDPGDRSGGLTLDCNGAPICTGASSGPSDLYSSTYRVGTSGTSRGDLLQTFVASTSGVATGVHLKLRSLRAFVVPPVHPLLRVALHAVGNAAEPDTTAPPVATGEFDLTTVPSSGDVLVPLVGAALTQGETYALSLSADGLPAGSTLFGIGALSTVPYGAGSAFRRNPRRADSESPWSEVRWRTAGPFDVAFSIQLSDQDNDGVPDAQDNCPTVANVTQVDLDNDAKGDACDPCPTFANPGNQSCPSADQDGDGILDTVDTCVLVPNPGQEDSDGDVKGDACDACPFFQNYGNAPCPPPNDLDFDGVPNAIDNCPTVANTLQQDLDNDAKGDLCDVCPTFANPGNVTCPTAGDPDNDGILDPYDNCPNFGNVSQDDFDHDLKGDACDPCFLYPNPGNMTCPSFVDGDGDGVPDTFDDCPSIWNLNQADQDADGKGDLCDACPTFANPGNAACPSFGDQDGDGVPDAQDNCPTVPNMAQEDADMDAKGDACDACPNFTNPGNMACPSSGDQDSDGVPDAQDNCPTVPNVAQADLDMDAKGDVCDACPTYPNPGNMTCPSPNDLDNDGVLNAVDNCPTVPNVAQEDADMDAKGDACDACPTTPNPGNMSCP